MIVSLTSHGDYSRVTNWLERLKEILHMGILDQYGKIGVAALAAATPKRTGYTASCWYYEITQDGGVATISFHNSHINKGVNIAIILQFGHGTRNGGYVQGRDYINPAIQPVFEQMADAAWKEVTSLL